MAMIAMIAIHAPGRKTKSRYLLCLKKTLQKTYSICTRLVIKM
jgi:hypothetical protein